METGEQLYHELIAPIEQQMMRTVAGILRDPEDAADVFQEVLAIVWRKLRRIHRQPNPHRYILRICVNASYDALRKRARTRGREVSLGAEARATLVGTPGGAPEAGEREETVMQAISALPAKQAKAVLLRVVEDLPYAAIGGMLGCSEATARSHVSKGKAHLRTILSDPHS